MVSTAIHQVPTELWDRIVGFICEGEKPEAVKKLCMTFCLTSRALNTAASCVLYREIQTNFLGGNAARVLSTLLQDSGLSQYVQTLHLTQNVKETEPRCETEEEEKDFYKTCEQQFHDFAHGNGSALVPRTGLYAPFMPVWYSIEKFLDNGNDLTMLAHIVAQMQKDGLLGNFRMLRIHLNGRGYMPWFSYMDMIAAVLSIPKLERLFLDIDSNWSVDHDTILQPFAATSNVKDIKITSLKEYGGRTLYRLMQIIKRRKGLEHLAVEIGDKGLALERIRQAQPTFEELIPDEDALHFQTLLGCLLPHQETLTSLYLDVRLCHSKIDCTINSFATFRSLENLRLDMTPSRRTSLSLSGVEQLMAPNLKSLTLYIYVDTLKGFETFGRIMLSAPDSLQHLAVTFVASRSGIVPTRPPPANLCQTELFEIDFWASSDERSYLVTLQTHHLLLAIQRCETPDLPSFSEKQQHQIERLFLDERIREFVSGTTVARDLFSLCRVIFLATGNSSSGFE